MEKYIWSSLNALQIGKYAEYYAKMEFTLYGFDVFTSEVDDKGIDFVAKINNQYFDVDNPEHTHPLSGKKARIQKEINSLKNPSFRHASMPKREQIVKMASQKQGKKGRVRPFSGAYAPREPRGCKNARYSGAYPPIFSI